MRYAGIGFLKYGLLAAAISVLPLSGCSSMGSFGGGPAKIAELPSDGIYTSDGVLAEARGHFRANNFGYSAAYYKKAVNLSPDNPEGYVGLGASYDRLGRFDLADRVYDALYNMTGGSVQYYNNLGYSHMLRGDLKTALINFRKAADLAPTNIIIANNIQLLADAAATRA
ncbi:tetratricopeptide repeat protein [Mariluticola halotolerans]|uniref:tetratricopeptide repeat protein n=1 Tax=Mariluticola halotolerans TaxID=2909283 RepID=UPI0026E2BC22|nr:tetratricopeptide repeat protein [Mariluticola halotolerans]UJQ95324.1 tetratricopeptide repeat protein [Mariluticola halotolerans]